MKKIIAILFFSLVSNDSLHRQLSFLEIFGRRDNVLITVKTDFPPRFSFNILEGLCYRTHGSIRLENKGDKACRVFFIDLNINGNYFKCKNTDYSIMRYVDDFLETNQSITLNVRWDIAGNYNTISAVENIKCPIRIDILGDDDDIDDIDDIMQISNIRFIGAQ